LPSVKSSAAATVEDTTKPQEDVDAAFKQTVTRALSKIEVKEVKEKPTLDDENKTFRTRLVAFWMLTNAALSVAIENINGLETASNLVQDQLKLREKQNLYFAVILFSTFALAAVRFTGVSYRSSKVYSTGLMLVSSACSIS
jgi:chitin synthase